ncbi:hypothetical protein HanPSC8_Chr09g0388001 [Helianthus annuus]|nr:hypothetical protein HanPSC8_Chr09g0388001 [Helianthus annuus]
MELTSRMKIARFKPFGSRCGKTNLWTKVAKLAKPQGRKWHFTLETINKVLVMSLMVAKTILCIYLLDEA